jgi:2-oxo-4-hydroxy-4-carboxy-5-ureidoimidazoline decarboxylase
MLKLGDLNGFSRDQFTSAIGSVFEHSPWIAERTWEHRPFANRDGLHAALCRTVTDADSSEKLALIRAHPDLVTRVELTKESAAEQTSAGLADIDSEERAKFQDYNKRYRERFGFPFVICARMNNRQAILDAFAARLNNSVSEETETALNEIYKIAKLRLADLVE